MNIKELLLNELKETYNYPEECIDSNYSADIGNNQKTDTVAIRIDNKNLLLFKIKKEQLENKDDELKKFHGFFNKIQVANPDSRVYYVIQYKDKDKNNIINFTYDDNDKLQVNKDIKIPTYSQLCIETTDTYNIKIEEAIQDKKNAQEKLEKKSKNLALGMCVLFLVLKVNILYFILIVFNFIATVFNLFKETIPRNFYEELLNYLKCLSMNMVDLGCIVLICALYILPFIDEISFYNFKIKLYQEKKGEEVE